MGIPVEVGAGKVARGFRNRMPGRRMVGTTVDYRGRVSYSASWQVIAVGFGMGGRRRVSYRAS